MNISFQKKSGKPSLNIEFFWKISIFSVQPATITDLFIPELYFDYFFVKEGNIQCLDKTKNTEFTLPRQSLKTLYTHPLVFTFSPPLILFGARLSLGFAESYWDEELPSNSFLEQDWVSNNTHDLSSFEPQVVDYLQIHQKKKTPYPLLTPAYEETSWLASYSPRHKRRLYKTTFGINRKEMQTIRNVHAFMDQTCNFDPQPPRIIRHIDPDVFYDQPHLNHAFKKLTGLSPLEYFEASSILQDNLLAASYNEIPVELDKI